MKQNFLMDENLVVLGMLEKPLAARDVWIAVAENCHRILLSASLASKYWEKINLAKRRARGESATPLVAIVNQIMRNADKTIWVEPGEQSPREHMVRHYQDWYLEDIALDAVTSGSADHCHVVTVDAATRDNFNRPEFKAAHIYGLTIEDGLAAARESGGS